MMQRLSLTRGWRMEPGYMQCSVAWPHRGPASPFGCRPSGNSQSKTASHQVGDARSSTFAVAHDRGQAGVLDQWRDRFGQDDTCVMTHIRATANVGPQ